MLLIIILCLIILLTYLGIIFYLGYIFLKDRKTFSIFQNSIIDNYNNFINAYIYCPVHSILPYDKNNINNKNIKMCYLCDDNTMENGLYIRQLEILNELYGLFNRVNRDNLPEKQFRDEFKMYLSLLEYCIKNYEYIKNEKPEIYYTLKTIYMEEHNIPTKKGEYNTKKPNTLYSNCDDIIIDFEKFQYLENEMETILKIYKCINKYVMDSYVIGSYVMDYCDNYNYLLAFFIDISKFINNLLL